MSFPRRPIASSYCRGGKDACDGPAAAVTVITYALVGGVHSGHPSVGHRLLPQTLRDSSYTHKHTLFVSWRSISTENVCELWARIINLLPRMTQRRSSPSHICVYQILANGLNFNRKFSLVNSHGTFWWIRMIHCHHQNGHWYIVTLIRETLLSFPYVWP